MSNNKLTLDDLMAGLAREGISPNPEIQNLIKENPTKKKKPKSAAGVTLEQLVQSIAKNGLEMSADIKKLVNEEDARKASEKAANRKPKSPKGTKTNTSHANTEWFDENSSFGVENVPGTDKRGVLETQWFDGKTKKANVEPSLTKTHLQNFLGKDTARKLVKKETAENTEENLANSESAQIIKNQNKQDNDLNRYGKELERIRVGINEIHEYLFGKGKQPLAPTSKRPAKESGGRKLLRGFVRGAFGAKIGAKLAFNPKSSKTERVSKDKSPTTSRIPGYEAFGAAKSLQDALSRQKVQNNQTSTVPPKPANAASNDQATAEHTKEEVIREDEAKSTNEKLDKIIADLEELKKRQGRNNRSSFGLTLGRIMAALAGAWKAVKFIGKVVGKVWDLSKKAFSFMKENIGKIWSKMTELTKGLWSKVKGLVPEGISVAEVAAGAGAAAITATEAYAVDRLAKYEYDRAKTPFDQLEKDYGLKALNNGNFELNGQKYHNYGGSDVQGDLPDLPEQYKTLITAKTGDTRGGTSKKAQEYIAQHQPEFEALKKKTTSIPMQPPKQLPQALNNVTTQKADLTAEKDAEMPVVVVKGGNKTVVVPQPQQSSGSLLVTTRNPDPSADILNGGSFDAPQGHGAIYRM